MKKSFILICFFLYFNIDRTYSQNFDYSFQLIEQEYEEISDTNKLFSYDDFNQIKSVPIGFEFSVCGQPFDSVQLKTTGLLSFDSNRSINFIFFNKEFLFSSSSNGETSVSYINFIDENNVGVLKIQFKNLKLLVNETEIVISFQIWLKQYSNRIEFHMGNCSETSIPLNCMLGLINTFNTELNPVGYLLSGSSESPIGNFIPAKGNIVEMTSFPKANQTYIFINNNL